MIKQQQNVAAIYCRLSRDDGGDAESNSIGTQRDMLRRYANEHGFFIFDEYVDDGISGTTFERDSFKRMINDVEEGKIGVILCKDLSRLGRNNAMVAYYTELFFPDRDVRFIAINNGIDSAKGENEIMGFKSIINEYYARDISKKIRSSMRTIAQKGQFIGGHAPYGYRLDPADRHHLIPDEETAPVVREMLCKKGKVDLILIKSLSRFARNTVDSLNHIRALKAIGIGIYFEKENLNTLEIDNEVILTIHSCFAQAESESISANVKWGKRQSFKEGKVCFQYSRMLGYEKGEDGRPKIVPEQAALVRRVFYEYLDGKSVEQIRQSFDSDGIASPVSKKGWSREGLKNILRNEKYIGEVYF